MFTSRLKENLSSHGHQGKTQVVLHLGCTLDRTVDLLSAGFYDFFLPSSVMTATYPGASLAYPAPTRERLWPTLQQQATLHLPYTYPGVTLAYPILQAWPISLRRCPAHLNSSHHCRHEATAPPNNFFRFTYPVARNGAPPASCTYRPYAATQRTAHQFGLTAPKIISAKFICMGNRKNRLTTTRTRHHPARKKYIRLQS